MKDSDWWSPERSRLGPPELTAEEKAAIHRFVRYADAVFEFGVVPMEGNYRRVLRKLEELLRSQDNR